MRIRCTARHVFGHTDYRAIWGSPGGDALSNAEVYYSQPHVRGCLLDHLIAFPEPPLLAAMWKRLVVLEADGGREGRDPGGD